MVGADSVDQIASFCIARIYDSSGVPQGSVLGPLLYIYIYICIHIYINDLEENVAGLISKFADDTKIGGVADSDEDCQRIQQDIDRLENWAEKWQMEFNPDKCEVMHFGRSNSGGNYNRKGRIIRSIDIERSGSTGPQVLKSGSTGRKSGEESIWHACLHQTGH